MKKIAAVIALAVFACGAASASDKTDAMAVVDAKTAASYCADDAQKPTLLLRRALVMRGLCVAYDGRLNG